MEERGDVFNDSMGSGVGATLSPQPPAGTLRERGNGADSHLYLLASRRAGVDNGVPL